MALKLLAAHPRLATFLDISAKHAVRALYLNAALNQMLPEVFNFHNPAGMWSFAKAVGATIFAGEAQVWGPRVIAWFNRPDPPFTPLPPEAPAHENKAPAPPENAPK